jgi:hypothetical protein
MRGVSGVYDSPSLDVVRWAPQWHIFLLLVWRMKIYRWFGEALEAVTTELHLGGVGGLPI